MITQKILTFSVKLIDRPRVAQKQFIDKSARMGDYQFRFSNFFDKDSIEFQNAYSRQHLSFPFEFHDSSDGQSRTIEWTPLSFWQSHHYNVEANKRFYLLQTTNQRSGRLYQTVVQVNASKMDYFKEGLIDKWSIALDANSLVDQLEILKQLKIFCLAHTDLMTLRLRPYLPGAKAIMAVANIAEQVGFKKCASTSYERTRLIDLRPSIEEIEAQFSRKNKPKLKNAELVSLREINERDEIPHLQSAVYQSFLRSGGRPSPIDFDAFFSLKKKYPDQVIILGFYFQAQPKEPKAFVMGINHGNTFEYWMAGSMSDPVLRKFNFNSVLLWNLIAQAKKNGSHVFDLGGITSGDEGDSLKGISAFKRAFPGFELDVCSEMLLTLKPSRVKMLRSIRQVQRLVKRK